jgi:hypothetical protein
MVELIAALIDIESRVDTLKSMTGMEALTLKCFVASSTAKGSGLGQNCTSSK